MTKKTVLILLSDTDSVFASVCKNKFNKTKGWLAEVTSSQKEAINLIQKNKPQLILTDIILQDGNGVDLLTEIRKSKDSVLAKTPVIILTDLSQDEDRKKALANGATEYLVKNEISLLSVINKIDETL